MPMDEVVEPGRRVRVVRDVDVVVVGSGVSGVFAALGAAEVGARVLLMDRFGQLGGNMGPGLFIGSVLYKEPGKTLHLIDYPGIPRQFVDRLEAMLAADDLPRGYPRYTQCISRLAQEMMDEAGVERMHSVYAADPVMDGDRVVGVFVETKSGRVAVRARVVVDATGDADVARRAGAPFRSGSSAEECDSPNITARYNRPEFRTWNDGGVYFAMAGTDIARFREFCAQEVTLSDEDDRWAAELFASAAGHWPLPMVPVLHRAMASGEFAVWRTLRPRVGVGLCHWFEQLGPGLAGGRAQMMGEFDTGDWEDVSLLEDAVRRHTFDAVEFLRKSVPGFEKAYVMFVSPFLGARGGPFIEGEYVLRPHELWQGMSAPDTVFRSYVGAFRGGTKEGCDMPYRMFLPKGVDGLLVSGRGMSFLRRGHDPSVRARCNATMLGQAAGAAAGLAAKDQVQPRDLDVSKLQRHLHAQGYPYGDDERLKELALT